MMLKAAAPDTRGRWRTGTVGEIKPGPSLPYSMKVQQP
jgi:hypothetical protein